MLDPTSLVAWQVADQLAQEVFRIATVEWDPPSAAAWEQARRASLSVSLNIVEGYAWSPSPRWRYHLQVANGSALETYFALRFLRDTKVISSGDAEVLLQLADRSKRLVWGLLQTASRAR